MRRSILMVSELILATCLVQSLAAQEPALRRGTRVRVTVTRQVSRTPLVGVVDSVRDGILVMGKVQPFSVRIPLSQVTGIEVSRGQKRPTWSKTAPLWLTASAGGLGAIVGYATTRDDDFFGPGFGAAVLGGLGGVLGLLVGTGLAVGVKHDTWEPVLGVSSDSRVSVPPGLYVAPASRGARLGVRATF